MGDPEAPMKLLPLFALFLAVPASAQSIEKAPPAKGPAVETVSVSKTMSLALDTKTVAGFGQCFGVKDATPTEAKNFFGDWGALDNVKDAKLPELSSSFRKKAPTTKQWACIGSLVEDRATEG